MSTAPLRKFTIQEYLDSEESATMKHQFYRGEIFAMPGGSLNHARIIRNLGRFVPIQLDNTPFEYLANNEVAEFARIPRWI
ncbi:MAG: hypothetical protein SFX18_06485 [Pirellulales bacterium]|nr:hypothetical protein [Pirellulales bacterium]